LPRTHHIPMQTFHCIAPLRPLHPFPTRRSSDLGEGTRGRSMPFIDDIIAAREQYLAHGWLDIRHPAVQNLAHALQNGSLSLFERSEEHTSELQSRFDLVCRLLLEKKNTS